MQWAKHLGNQAEHCSRLHQGTSHILPSRAMLDKFLANDCGHRIHLDESHEPHSSVVMPIPNPNHANAVREATSYVTVQQHFRNMLLHRCAVLVAMVTNLPEDIAFVRPPNFGIVDLANRFPPKTWYVRINHSGCSPSERMGLVRDK